MAPTTAGQVRSRQKGKVMGVLRDVRTAFSFLTVLPVPTPRDFRRDDLRRATPHYPLAWLGAWWASRRLGGGITGDVVGALIMLCEVAALLPYVVG